MEPLRRTLVQTLAIGAFAAPFLAPSSLRAAADGSDSPDSKLMGAAKFIDVEGIRTRYFDGGSGEALVLVHGGQWPSTASADGWAPIFDHLAAHFHVYAFDKLGMGYTDNPKSDADYSMDAIIRHVYGFIQAVGITRAVLVGHSRGALPVARIAADHPELVSHLVILDSNTLAPDDPNTPDRVDPAADRAPPTKEEIRRAALANRQSYRKEFLTDSYVEAEYRIAQLPKLQDVDRRFREARDAWVAANPEIVKQHPLYARNMGATTWWMYQAKYETLARIEAGRLKVPTIIIWGFNDPTAPYFLGVNLMETLSKTVDRTELHIINHSGHLIAAEHPEEVTRLIAGFMA
jgi:2-hydroxy-6-oxo-6-(2'-carboxyphenyl)-hexa-2,4-dienoate hydrolase